VTQDQLIVLLFKIALVADVASIVAFIAVYWRLAPWWRNPIGRTIVTKDFLLILLLLPSVLSLFFQFNRLTSRVAAWADLGLFVLLAAVMTWRCAVWIRVHRDKEKEGS
jgi:membrane associated rhomboid family serine protease